MAETDIAVVGMACRLPGARNPEEFWRLLRDGREARVDLSDEHLRAAGVPPALLADPDYVKAAMLLDGIDQFDAGFFGFSPRDAALFDPQHRVFLECAWEAFEHAGHVPERFGGRVGVFAGCGMDTYLLHNILTNPDLVRRIGMFLVRHTGNDKDFLATRVSYQFDLRGPSVNVLTACSSSLVAIHQAAHSLLSGECDMALAGGVTILVPQDRGYLYKDGEILSPDGKCRAFDADSKGTIFGSGAGIVLLRRLQDAIDDRDRVLAVVAGSAVNNDGGRKVGYLAPSVDGYAECVAEALALADLSADRVQYVESHGTGTQVGDPIEIEALTQAFRATTGKTGYCGIGSVKTNIGHLDTAAGVAGFLKVVLAMQHGELPASLNYRRPNPLIDFPRSPFQVVAERRPWPRPAGGERIAGCSSLGVGGTNAHVLLRDAPESAPAAVVAYPRRCHLLPVSGKGDAAAAGNARALAEHLRAKAEALVGGALADAAWTLQWGRKAFPQRGFAVGASAVELAEQLTAPEWKAQLRKAPDRAPSVVFLFPGGGAQYPGMARALYECEPAFRAAADTCLKALPAATAATVASLLFGDLATAAHGAQLERPSLALPALFLVEYGLARTLQSWGIEPDAMLGHSMGEYVAATLGGTFTVEQGMQVVLLRGDLFEQVQEGAMLTVPLSADEVLALGDAELSLAAANAPQLSAVAGTVAAIDRAEARLGQQGLEVQRLRIGVAAHSHLLDPILDRFRAGLRAMRLQPAKKPWVSNVTGDFVDAQRAADADYWVEHLRRTVRFQDGVATLLAGGDRVFVEVGPGKALTSLARMHQRAAKSAAIVTLPHAKEAKAADAAALEALGRLWQLGAEIDWRAFQGGAARRRVELPTYAFQRQRHWIEPGASLGQEGVLRRDDEAVAPTRLPDSDWLRQPVFRHQELPATVAAATSVTWLCVGGGALADEVVRQVSAAGGRVARIMGGAVEARSGDAWTLPLSDGHAWDRALAQVTQAHGAPQRVLFAEPLAQGDASELVLALLAMWQALGRADQATLRCLSLTAGACRVGTEPMERPGQGVVAGFLRVVPREYPGARTRAVDLDRTALGDPAATVAWLRREIEADDVPLQVARRAGARHVQELVAVEPPTAPVRAPFRENGVYLLSGGLGGIGLLLAEHLAGTCAPKLVLVGRRGLPRRELWDRWVQLRPGDRNSQLIRRIRELERRGAEVMVAAADVTDRAAVDGLVRAVKGRFRALHGIVHAAGVLDDGLIQMRTPEQVRRMLAPKIEGAHNLDAATAGERLDLFVVFGSTSGLAGIPGQCDYAAANAGLDAFAHWRSAVRPGRTLAVDWGIWQDAGMVAGATVDAAPPLPRWLGERTERDQAIEFTGAWSPATHWQLAEHRVNGGDCVLPGTGHLELMAAAVQAVAGSAQVSLNKVEFLSPLAFAGDRPRHVVVAVHRLRDGFEVVVQSAEHPTDDEHQRTTHAKARASIGADGAETVEVAAWRAEASTEAQPSSDQARHVAFGPRWQCLRRVRTGDGVAIGDLQLPAAFQADLADHPLHPALLDMAFGCGIRLLSQGAADALFVPVGVDEVVVSGRLAGEVTSRVVVRARDDHARLHKVDVVVATPDGIVLCELRGLQLFGVRGGFAASGEARAGQAKATPGPVRAAPSSAGVPVPRIRAILGRGITGPEGMVGLARALAAEVPQVVVSSLDIARTAHWLSLPPEKPAAANVPPPAAGVTADAPRDDVERRLADSFHDLLGVEQPGLDQDFFELGGHSLLAVRLFARIHKEFGLDLELATLLSAGTVRKLAAVVRAELKLPEPGSEPVRSVAARKGQFVVPIQVEGTRPKLFLVHGAGGNVLGFRDLAHYFGKDQPVYGLQARGVDGKQPPHETILEMAKAYLAEIREVQPHGPYFLGGYSGGGVVAYEMAQLLGEVGEPVAFVGMIDSWCPHLQKRGKVSRAVMHVGRMLRRGPMYPVDILKMKLQRRASAKRNEQARQQGGPLPQSMRGEEVQFAFERSFATHAVRPYEGKVWLFRCTDHDLGTRYVFDEKLGWGPFVKGGIAVTQCPGNHFTMCTEPNVQILCRQMMAGIDEAIAATARR
jgi:acyl transferase domain-containing protein/thioesterase domain-containing protein/acyl carrier protein